MYIVTSNPENVVNAATMTGVRADWGVAGRTRDGRYNVNVRLFPIEDKYQRVSFSGGGWGMKNPPRPRRIYAVCYHDYEAFVQNLWKIDPNAKVMSSMTRGMGQRWMDKDRLIYSRFWQS
jgi:hypothetical protein